VRTLDDWQHLHERITIHRRASLLQAADERILRELVARPEIRQYLVLPTESSETNGRSTGPGKDDNLLVRIAPGLGQVEGLARALSAAGYPPARTEWAPVSAIDGPGRNLRSTATRCIRIAPDGEVRFDIPLPGIHTLQQIAPFTQRDEQSGRTYLTRASIERALQGGLGVQDILDALRSLHLGPLPRWVEIRIRAWGHYYGDAAVQTVTLIQVRDQATLEELLSEPELKDLLRPFAPAETRGLAWVSDQDLHALYAALAERGIAVRDELA